MFSLFWVILEFCVVNHFQRDISKTIIIIIIFTGCTKVVGGVGVLSDFYRFPEMLSLFLLVFEFCAILSDHKLQSQLIHPTHTFQSSSLLTFFGLYWYYCCKMMIVYRYFFWIKIMSILLFVKDESIIRMMSVFLLWAIKKYNGFLTAFRVS